jgi:hypothetical protein
LLFAFDQRTRRIELWSSIAVLVVVVLLTFGVFTPRFGVYHDETVSFYILSRLGFLSLLELVWGQARPVFAVLMWVIRDSVIGAHLLMLLFHAGNAILLLLILRRALAGQLFLALMVSISYCVYPLYWFRPAIVNLAIDGSLFFCLLSFGLCALAIEVNGWKRWCAVFASIACVPIYFFLYELPFPLEALRPLLLWRTLHDGVAEAGRPRWLRTLMWSLPWLVLAGGLGCYRLFVFKSSGFYQSINYNTPSLPPTLGGEIGTRLTLLWDQLVGTWLYHIAQLPRALTSLDLAVAAATILAIILYALVNYRIIKSDLGQHRPRGIFAVGLIGLFILVIAQLPLVAVRQTPTIDGLASRWNLVSTIGASLLIVAWTIALAGICFRCRAVAASLLVLCPLIGVGAAFQVNNSMAFIRDWDAQRQLWWQLAWRIPDLEDNTTVIVDHPYRAAQSRPILIYETLMMGSLFFNNDTISVINSEQAIPGHWEINGGNWRTGWSYDLDRAILVHLDDAGCVEIIDRRAQSPGGVRLSPSAERLVNALPANPGQFIKASTNKPFPDRLKYFQPEPPHDRCYRHGGSPDAG